jgi:hypothetical protein
MLRGSSAAYVLGSRLSGRADSSDSR